MLWSFTLIDFTINTHNLCDLLWINHPYTANGQNCYRLIGQFTYYQWISSRRLGLFVRHSMALTLRLCQHPMEDLRVRKRLHLR